MSLIVVTLAAAAAAGISGLLAARAVRRRRQRLRKIAAPAQSPGAETGAETSGADTPPVDPLAGWALAMGDVVQFGDETRWLRSAVLAHTDEGLRCAVLIGDEGATALMAPPDRHFYWMRRETMSLPASSPARIEIGGLLLERRMSLPVRFEALGEDPPDVPPEGVLNLYVGSVGDAALLLAGETTTLWYGLRLAPDDVDRLGQGE